MTFGTWRREVIEAIERCPEWADAGRGNAILSKELQADIVDMIQPFARIRYYWRWLKCGLTVKTVWRRRSRAQSEE